MPSCFRFSLTKSKNPGLFNFPLKALRYNDRHLFWKQFRITSLKTIIGKTLLGKNEFGRIFPVILKTSGIDFSLYKHPTLSRAIQRRMAAVRAKDVELYIQYLKTHKDEGSLLAQSMLIKVTGFFRDPAVFEKLSRKVFPAIFKQKKHDSLRIWISGCSTGEEVYSIAIVLTEYLRNQKLTVPFQIFGTDLSEAALQKARTGIYHPKEIKNVKKNILSRYFTLRNGQYQIDKNIRRICTFARQNLVQDPPFSKIDLISCRNVLIYLGSDLQDKIIQLFHYALNDHGFLVLGASESIRALQPNLFHLFDKQQNIYLKRTLVNKPKVSFRFDAAYLNEIPSHPKELQRSEIDVGREMDRILIEKTEFPTVLINDANDIVQSRGDVSPYLRIPSGKTTFNVLKLVREDLSIELKMLIDKARKRSGILSKRVDCGARKVDIEIRPVHKFLSKDHYLMILFSPAETPEGKPGTDARKAESKKITYLKQEISAMKAYMQSMMNEHETAVDELKSANEEVLSSNEELQSLNEELETAKEELESANEELTTVNEELQTQMEARRQSEERFRVLIESVQEYAIFMLDPKGFVTSWNRGAERIKGYKAEEIVGQHFSKFYPPEDKEKPQVDLEQAAKKGVYVEEGWRVRKEGSKFWASMVITALKDKAGKLKGFAKVTRDMSDRKRSDDLLRKSEEYARSIVRTANDAFISTNDKSMITDWNARAEIIFGWTREKVLGRTLTETIIPERFREAHLKGMERFLKTGIGPVLYKTIELTALHRDGHEFPVELTLWPMQMDNEFSFHAFIRDITERKKMEAAAQRINEELEERVKKRTTELQLYSEELIRSNADLQQFAYIASHDLQEPLRMVSAYVDLLSERLKGQTHRDVKDYIRFVQEGAIRAQQLINELLEYSRIGTKALHFVSTSMEEIMKHVLSLLELAIKESGAAIVFDSLPVLTVDRFQMEQLLQNLVSNAIKYRSKKPLKIFISANRKDGQWEFTVTDNGIGMDPEYKDSIFTIFKRLHSRSEYPGTGIGLALAKKIVERHGGEIWVESQLGQGSTFHFTLPEKRG